jgi:hypothetical protein
MTRPNYCHGQPLGVYPPLSRFCGVVRPGRGLATCACLRHDRDWHLRHVERDFGTHGDKGGKGGLVVGTTLLDPTLDPTVLKGAGGAAAYPNTSNMRSTARPLVTALKSDVSAPVLTPAGCSCGGSASVYGCAAWSRSAKSHLMSGRSR